MGNSSSTEKVISSAGCYASKVFMGQIKKQNKKNKTHD